MGSILLLHLVVWGQKLELTNEKAELRVWISHQLVVSNTRLIGTGRNHKPSKHIRIWSSISSKLDRIFDVNELLYINLIHNKRRPWFRWSDSALSLAVWRWCDDLACEVLIVLWTFFLISMVMFKSRKSARN